MLVITTQVPPLAALETHLELAAIALSHVVPQLVRLQREELRYHLLLMCPPLRRGRLPAERTGRLQCIASQSQSESRGWPGLDVAP